MRNGNVSLAKTLAQNYVNYESFRLVNTKKTIGLRSNCVVTGKQ